MSELQRNHGSIPAGAGFGAPRPRSLLRDVSGAVTVEYVIVFAFVGLTTAAGFAAAAPRLVQHYSAQRAQLYSPFP